MDHDSNLQLLGLSTARGHQLELVTAQILARALRVDESTARLLTTAMGLGAALGVLQTLAARGECGSLSSTALNAWMRQAKAANEARNRVIHTPWVAGAGGAPDSVVVKGSMTLENRSEADLRQDVALLAAAVDGGYALMRQ